MDYFSLSIGFLIGAFTGAAGTYLGNKFTDQRRAKEAANYEDEEWNKLLKRFPEIMKEMIEDVNNPEFKGVRKFFVAKSTWSINYNDPCFSYYTDRYKDLEAAILYLEELGYIEDITPGNCPMYRMREEFIDRLRNV